MTTTKSSTATIRDVARKAGVSVATVSRYINHTVPVSEEVATRLQEVMHELRFIPRAAARNLATHKTNALGLLLTEISGDFFAPLLKGIEQAAGEAGFDLLISTASRAGQVEKFPLPLGPHNTDGLLVFTGSMSEQAVRQYHELGFPMVLIHQSSPAGLKIPCVTVENKGASRQIVEHLIQVHGRRRIVFIQGAAGQEDSFWREAGYLEALERSGLPYDPALVAPGEFDRLVAQESITRLLAAGVACDAVFACDDESAVGVLEALQAARKHVPKEVAVVGFDDQRLSAYLNPTLTTVRAPTEEVGRSAARQLVKLIRTGLAEPLVLLPTEIVVRRSCGCKR